MALVAGVDSTPQACKVVVRVDQLMIEHLLGAR